MQRQREWAVYVIQSERDGRYYCGIALDVAARVAQHNAGKGAKATRGRGPWHCVYGEWFATKGQALRREAAIKKLTRKQKEVFICTKL